MATGNEGGAEAPVASYRGPSQEKLLRGEQIRLLYSTLPTAIIVNALLALLFAFMQRTEMSPDQLYGWLALLAIILLVRTGLFIVWKHAGTRVRRGTGRWLWTFRVSVTATGIAWGIGSVLHMPSIEAAHHAYISFILAGLTAGAVTYLSIDPLSTVGFLVPTLVPHTVYLAAQGDAGSLSMSATIALFLLFLMANARQTGILLRDNFKLRFQASEDEARLRQMLESSPVATRVVDADSNRVVFANTSYVDLIGSTPEKIIGLIPLQYYAHPEEYAHMLEELRKGKPVTNQLIELRSPEQTWTKWVLASYFQTEYGGRPAILGWFYDITDRKLMEERVRHLAHHDPLTGLPNRSLFDDRLQQALSIAKRVQDPLALMFIDLDRFKPVNDEHGHDIGDLLLQAVAERIRGCLRESDSLARIGGDEFIVLLPSVKAAQDALTVAQKIRQALNRPFQISALTLNISSSTGIAIYPGHGDTGQQLIKHADTAMYHAKAHGRNGVYLYRAEMEKARS